MRGSSKIFQGEGVRMIILFIGKGCGEWPRPSYCRQIYYMTLYVNLRSWIFQKGGSEYPPPPILDVR